MNRTFPQLLLQHAAERGDAPALREKEYGIWQTHSWVQLAALVEQVAAGLQQAGLQRGEHMVVIGSNRPRLYATMLAIQAVGAIPVPLYQDAVAAECVYPLTNAEVRFAMVEDQEQVDKLLEIRERCPLLARIWYDDPRGLRKYNEDGLQDIELLIQAGAAFAAQHPGWFRETVAKASADEVAAMFYTSGTTGNPKGVVYHHRGAYLNAMSNIVSWGMPPHAVYLWTLPMFHCNGWCFAWTMAANAGVNVCLRRVDPKLIFDAIREHRVTHYCGAPIVHSLLANAPAQWREGIEHKVYGLIAAAPPPAAVIEGMARIGFDITHVYGLTESYGPAAVCAKHSEWSALPLEEQVALNGRQGVRYHAQEAITVLDPVNMQPVPWDNETMGEIMFRGNLVMKGYLKNPKATEESFAGGYYHTGDLAVMQPDGYVKIKDRSKDVIISGGENISSIEVEDVLYKHPAVMAAAVVAAPDEKWGEVPCAFLELRDGASATEQEIVDFCRERMARYKVPKRVVFGALPKTSTGKIQKFVLREQAKSAAAFE